jgi:hypothetical protein
VEREDGRTVRVPPLAKGQHSTVSDANRVISEQPANHGRLLRRARNVARSLGWLLSPLETLTPNWPKRRGYRGGCTIYSSAVADKVCPKAAMYS